MPNGLDNIISSSEHQTRTGNLISGEKCTLELMLRCRCGSTKDLDTLAFPELSRGSMKVISSYQSHTNFSSLWKKQNSLGIFPL